ncbi:MAG: hypothetical protein BRD44_03635 [Bacteroidetes bacterium QS_7_67_15]|nr:MAG: hypothetical protein BRD44_03635 [Bacteroidetes bacterium QS_7_67_15]
MDFPTPSAYQEALQHPETAFADAALQRAEPRTGPLGLPRPVTGAFAAVFPMTTPEGTTVAAKCFLSDAPDQQNRYRAVADHLADADLPYTVGFDYQPEGVRVGGAAFPLLKMDWAEGAPLNRFAEKHRGAPATLDALAEAWADMLADLEAANVAHGDLQHGNVLVRETPEGRPALTLVDYDTAFVPALAGKQSAEVGHRNYQHPDRTEDDFGPHLDRFAGLAVYVALRALASRPGLWEKYDTGENLLFRAADFYDPGASPLFAELGALDVLQHEVSALRAACHRPPEDAPTLADVRSGTAPVEADPAPRRRERAVPREGVARWFAPALGGALVVAALGAAVGWGLAAGGGLLGAVAAAGVVALRAYRRQSVVRRRRRLHREAARFAERIENLRREQQTLQEQRFIGEARGVEGLSHKTVVRLKAANVRTAYEATPEALAGVRKLGEASTARLEAWRAALVERYADDMPEALSPAQKRRLKRRAERRLEQIDEEAARTRRKIEVQRAEREDAMARAEALPALSFARYLRYLLHFESSLPSPEETQTPAPPTPVPPAEAPPPEASPAETPPAGPRSNPERPDPDRPEASASEGEGAWYEQRA